MRFGAVLLVALAVSACSTQDASTSTAPSTPATPSPSASPATTAPTPAISEDYLPGLLATMHLPAAQGPADLVVLVPGGGWSSADPTGLVPLAEHLADNGDTSVTVTYSTTTEGARFPTPADDVACSVRWAAKIAKDNGAPPQRVIVLGHSAGGHLASLVATSDDHFGADCPYPAVTIDGLIGMAGVYDIDWAGDHLSDFFGGSRDQQPERWNEGDPTWWVASGNADLRGLRVLLVHGGADDTVPVSMTQGYAAALRAAGNEPEVAIIPGQTHLTIFEADVIAPTIDEWLGP